MESYLLEKKQSISKFNTLEEIESLEVKKNNIFDQMQKNINDNQSIFENMQDLSGYFNDVKSMIEKLDQEKDQEAIKNLNLYLEEYTKNDKEFRGNLDKE